ncbi:MAG: hypothetical protein IKN25_03570, partial [Spirochaetales bacterium]|nr:hypothetical protein [Spirochaetales bacterium]
KHKDTGVCCYDMTGLSTVNADKINAENERFMPGFYGIKWHIVSKIPKIKHSIKELVKKVF